MKPQKLTKREIDILKILSEADRSLSASEINASRSDLNINTVQAALRSLLKKKYIEIADIGYSGTVLCRRYTITAEASEALFSYINESYATLARDFSLPSLVAYLLQTEDDPETLASNVAELDKIIKRYKKK